METTELILFIDDAPNEAAMFDRDMRYLAASRAWLETTRQTRDIIGRSHYDIFPALPDSWRISHQRGMAGERVYGKAEMFLLPDNTPAWANWEVRPWRSSEGDVGGILIFGENVTSEVVARQDLLKEASAAREARREAEMERRRLMAAIEASPDGVAVFDANDEVVAINSAFLDAIGADRDSIGPGSSSADVWETSRNSGVWDHSDPASMEWRRLRLSRQFDLLRVIERQDRNGKWWRIAAYPTSDGGALGTRTDITELKARERELADRTEALERQAIELKTFAEAAERANRAKTAFIAAMSHEIRTPLNAIVGFAKLVAQSGVSEESDTFASALISSTQHLAALVNDILDFTKLESDRLDLTLEPFSLDTLLVELDTTLKVLSRDKALDVGMERAADLPARIQGDRGRIAQILLNLISNATKFTQAGAIRFRITRESSGHGEARIRFEVRDTGLGITPAAAATLFEAFQQGDAASGLRASGAGLGLAISRRLARLMGGDVNFESEPGMGLRFWFEAPFPVATASDSTRPNTAAAATERRRLHPLDILVVEDTASSRLLLTTLLKRRGHRVREACDGAQALECLKQHRCDLIFMDIQMPVLDGLEATTRIRKLPPPIGRTPIVALTAEAFEDQKQLAFRAGMNKVITKPFNETSLDSVLRELAETSTITASEGVYVEAR